MSARSFMEVSDRLFLACRESYIPNLVALFTEDELRHDDQYFGYVSTAAELQDQLQLHGFTAALARAELDEAVRVGHARHANPDADDVGVPVRGSAELLKKLREYVNSRNEWAEYPLPDEVEWELDARTILRLILDVVEDQQSPVRSNLNDLQGYELLTPGIPITNQAREERWRAIATDAPLVILTEGSSDFQLLTDALRITHPHLVGFMRFMDFGSGAEGSAASLVKLARSFVCAGIANRVLVLAGQRHSRVPARPAQH